MAGVVMDLDSDVDMIINPAQDSRGRIKMACAKCGTGKKDKKDEKKKK
jgi:hypothetical protein